MEEEDDFEGYKRIRREEDDEETHAIKVTNVKLV